MSDRLPVLTQETRVVGWQITLDEALTGLNDDDLEAADQVRFVAAKQIGPTEVMVEFVARGMSTQPTQAVYHLVDPEGLACPQVRFYRADGGQQINGTIMLLAPWSEESGEGTMSLASLAEAIVSIAEATLGMERKLSNDE